MADSQTLTVATPLLDSGVPTLNLHDLPIVFILPTHLTSNELHEKIAKLEASGATVSHDVSKAQLILSALSSARRVRFEVQARGLKIDEVSTSPKSSTALDYDIGIRSPARKRRRISDDKPGHNLETMRENLDVSSEDEEPEKAFSQLSFSRSHAAEGEMNPIATKPDQWAGLPQNHVKVVKIDWLSKSIELGEFLDLESFTLFEGRRTLKSPQTSSPVSEPRDTALSNAHENPGNSQANAAASVSEHVLNISSTPRKPRRIFDRSRAKDVNPGSDHKHPALVRRTTSEEELNAMTKLPPMPQWVKEKNIYSCARATPPESENEKFIELLNRIRDGRDIIGDEVGVRAYRTSIASISAYPYRISSTNEILALPGCDQKIALLFQEYQTTGRLQAAEEIDKDPTLSTLKSFHSVHGIGWKTARDFYYKRGWRNLDDIVEHGWNELTREQQIGLKFHEELEQKIPRSEVEYIASIVTYYAKRLVDEDIVCVIVGGYRRGKEESGDVDIVLSHRSEEKTHYLINNLVAALEEPGYITHTLKTVDTNSDRDQQPLSMRTTWEKGSGFDSLDKANIVWQNPVWPTKAADLEKDPNARNPNVHRRVDIIISPWKTVGCAVCGWSSGTTYQRDLRRWARKKKGWKFDSSGVRDRATGRWVDLEKYSNPATRAKTWLEAEKRVFEGLGLEWRDPKERCTG